MKNRKIISNQFLHWTPRIIVILAILFVSMFALDSFSPELTIWQQIGDFFMHLIPSYVLIAILLIAWRWELIGGIFLILISAGMSPFIYQHNYNMNHSVLQSLEVILLINLPFFIAGILFVLEHVFRKKMLQSQ